MLRRGERYDSGDYDDDEFDQQFTIVSRDKVAEQHRYNAPRQATKSAPSMKINTLEQDFEHAHGLIHSYRNVNKDWAAQNSELEHEVDDLKKQLASF